jgi:hypothetical protein
MTVYDPENFMESTIRCLKDYAVSGFNSSVQAGGNPVGDQVYEVVMEFPGPSIDAKTMPMEKTIVHFEVDAVDDALLGMGDNIFSRIYDPATHVVYEKEAGMHLFSFDVGVWASDRSGGTTARLRARSVLRNLFHGPRAIEALKAATDGGDGGLEIMNWTGGRFLTERINDMDVYRMVDNTLELRVFSRTPTDLPPAPAIEEITTSPGLTIL